MDGDAIMVLAIVITGCVTGTLITSVVMLKDAITDAVRRRTPKLDGELLTEVRALREELQQLRQQNNDVMLGVDTTMETVNRRLARLESQGQLGAGTARPEGETQLVGRGASGVER